MSRSLNVIGVSADSNRSVLCGVHLPAENIHGEPILSVGNHKARLNTFLTVLDGVMRNDATLNKFHYIIVSADWFPHITSLNGVHSKTAFITPPAYTPKLDDVQWRQKLQTRLGVSQLILPENGSKPANVLFRLIRQKLSLIIPETAGAGPASSSAHAAAAMPTKLMWADYKYWGVAWDSRNRTEHLLCSDNKQRLADALYSRGISKTKAYIRDNLVYETGRTPVPPKYRQCEVTAV